MAKIKRALVSVSDKKGVVEFCRGLARAGVELVSTGGTARTLAAAGIPVRNISDLTGFPEILGGRVKTLHPQVHGGILNVRDDPRQQEEVRTCGIENIDLVVVNLYPFEATVAKPEATFEEAIENIDIGGPTLIRAAAKNWKYVTVIVHPEDYGPVLEEMRRLRGETSEMHRFVLAARAFALTAHYDMVIASWLEERPEFEKAARKLGLLSPGEEEEQKAGPVGDDLTVIGDDITLPGAGAGGAPARFAPVEKKKKPDDAAGSPHQIFAGFPRTLRLELHRSRLLRYGENPHQRAALYVDSAEIARSRTTGATIAAAELLGGKALSFNNLMDCDAALELAREFDGQQPFAAVFKHMNPCGAALSETLAEAYAKAYECDPTSAFGSVISFNMVVDPATAEEIAREGRFVECILAPGYEPEALEIITKRPRWGKNVRILKVDNLGARFGRDLRRISGGLLAQEPDTKRDELRRLQPVTTRSPSAVELEELEFAWIVCKHVRSNAIVLSKYRSAVGVGAGQMSRVAAVAIACRKAGSSAREAALASDAFFPFRDNIDVAAESGITAVIQPGGARNDDEVIKAANEHRIAMVFTGARHFRH